MKYFRVTIEYGHMGAGNGMEVTRYFAAEDFTSVFKEVRRMPGVKWRGGKAVKAIEAISKDRFITGKKDELKNPYLQKRNSMVSPKRFRCPICGREFKFLAAFKRHIKERGQTLEALPSSSFCSGG